MKAIKVSAANDITIVDLPDPLHRSLHDALGGYFEIVRPHGLASPFVMVVDEEGLLKDLPLNFVGSYLYGTHKHGSPIVGDIFIMREGPSPLGGYDLFGLSGRESEEIKSSIVNVLEFVKPNERR